MISENVSCNVCEKDLKLLNSHQLHDRKNYFGVRKHGEIVPGEMRIDDIRGAGIPDIRGIDAHICSYKCLAKYFMDDIIEEIEKEEAEEKVEKKRPKEPKKKVA